MNFRLLFSPILYWNLSAVITAEIYSPCSNNIEETKLDIEEDLLSPHNSVTKSCEDQDQDISSHGRLSHDSILTSGEAAHLESVSKYEFEVFEAETPGRGVSSVFICLYSVLGKIFETEPYLTWDIKIVNFGMVNKKNDKNLDF